MDTCEKWIFPLILKCMLLKLLSEMDSLWRENKWKHKPKELYPDVSCKDAPVPAALPVPQCDCGKPAEVRQSMHPDTAARAHYMCGDYRVSVKEFCLPITRCCVLALEQCDCVSFHLCL